MDDFIHKNKLNVVIGLMCRLANITNEDIEYFNKKYDNIREIKKRYKKNDSVILIGDYYLDMFNVDESNCRKISKLVALIKLIDKYSNRVLSDSAFRLSLPNEIINCAERKDDKFSDILENNETMDAVTLISDYICDNISNNLSVFNKIKIGASNKEDLDKQILSDIERTTAELRDLENIEADSQYNPYTETYMYTESCDFTDEVISILDKEERISNNEYEEYYCKYCGDELIFINNMTAYCESCDSTFILDKLNNDFVDNNEFYEDLIEDNFIDDEFEDEDCDADMPYDL